MSSPTDNTSPFQPSSSPKAIRATSDHSHSPVRHRDRGNSISSDVEPPTRPRLSPTLVRSYNPHDPEHRERQRTMDVDMAIQLSRARSNTVALSSPIISPQPHRASDDQLFPSLSLHEEHELDAARLGGPTNGDLDAISPFHPGPVQDTHTHLNHLSVAHDPALLVSLDTAEPDDTAMGGLPMYQHRTTASHSTLHPWKNTPERKKRN
ncbi:hypothetical protein NLI96_g1224 [Meripilus lineatus]|uniref:Uncharacterized protein n=1 Tax=Meripilus lineatus TaxID=2056292 RepID=A0AAD5VGD0_9APHY|nr:hypothetical protein NLI96_g1224 [Physisporinus lineatus]